jgi:hypothetical protein
MLILLRVDEGAGSKNMLSLAESVVLSARFARFCAVYNDFAPILRLSFA